MDILNPSVLVLLSAIIIGLLGLTHLIFTFVGPRLLPRDTSVIDAMKNTSPVLTQETTIWKAWLGFNASHSLGAILFASCFGYLATQQSSIFFSSLFLQLLGLAILIALLVLAKLFWFRTPLIGIALSLTFYAAGIWLK